MATSAAAALHPVASLLGRNHNASKNRNCNNARMAHQTPRFQSNPFVRTDSSLLYPQFPHAALSSSPSFSSSFSSSSSSCARGLKIGYFVSSVLSGDMIASSDPSDQERGTSPDVGDHNSTGEDRGRMDSSEKNELLWRAIKLPIYSVALVPLSVGSAVAFWQTGVFHIGRYTALLVSSMLVIAWLNLSNDAYDAETGVDKGKKESVVNMTGSQEGVLISAYICLVFGIMGLLWGAFQAHNMLIFALLAGAIGCGYIYQCPPFRLSYLGVGEPLCFTSFGPLATTAFYLSQSTGSLRVTGTILATAALVGITTTLILFCSHFHQIEGDKLVGKMSPLVRLGTIRGKEVVKFSIIGLYSLIFVLSATRTLPYPCAILSLLTAPIGKLVVDFVATNHDDKEKIFLAKYFCVRLHAAMGAALSLGYFLSSWISPVV